NHAATELSHGVRRQLFQPFEFERRNLLRLKINFANQMIVGVGDVERFESRRDAARLVELRLLAVAIARTALARTSESFALVLRRLNLFDLVIVGVGDVKLAARVND